jgi:type II restriction enzyme
VEALAAPQRLERCRLNWLQWLQKEKPWLQWELNIDPLMVPMAVNRDKPDRWKEDIACSVDMYNEWFMNFAPAAFRETRVRTTRDVEKSLSLTDNLFNIKPEVLRKNPSILPTLRMSTCPPLAVDRLIGLSGVSPNLVKSMELKQQLPPRMPASLADIELGKIAEIIIKMADPDVFVWLSREEKLVSDFETHRAATIIADRLCGAVANPIIRNAQEKRQLATIKTWLEGRGYTQLPTGEGTRFQDMPPGSFSFRMNVSVNQDNSDNSVNIPIDAVVKPLNCGVCQLPLFLEAKSAGDYTNTNKRRKEEAVKMSQLRSTYGREIQFNLFLCGYFDSPYLGYEAAEGIDWVWEHRIDDLIGFGI